MAMTARGFPDAKTQRKSRKKYSRDRKARPAAKAEGRLKK
jgi:hypothetical protein